MSVKVEEEREEEVPTFRQKCVHCLKGPNLIKTVVVVACTAVVVQQIITCIQKLIDVPITTYTHFDFNKTIMYPSVTFCREPPYKFTKMLDYGLYAHPRFTSVWLNYNFSATTLDQLWDDITYDHDEFFVQYGLDGEMDNIEIKHTTGFMQGRCYTLVPKVPNTKATRGSGYSIMLQHNADDVANSISIYPPGYHVYVHYTREPFTEVEVYNGGLVDYLYINTGETMEAKLTVDEYNKINKETDPCNDADNYSANNCTSQYVWDLVGEEVGCSGPWMISDLSPCDNFTAMRSLIIAYMATYENHTGSVCPQFCHANMYNAYVTYRQTLYLWDSKKGWALRTGEAELQSQLYMYFNTMMVSVYEERYNYDWNLFISDLGGSVGFLLGLSVISLMTICTKIWSTTIRPCIKNPKVKSSSSVSGSTITTKIDQEEMDKDEDMFKKCNDWNLKNAQNNFI